MPAQLVTTDTTNTPALSNEDVIFAEPFTEADAINLRRKNLLDRAALEKLIPEWYTEPKTDAGKPKILKFVNR